MQVNLGDKVKVKYKGTLNDGTVFDSTDEQGFPLKLTVGAGLFLDKFEKALVGMCLGETKEIHLSPSEAYGEYDPKLIKTIHKEEIPSKEDMYPGKLMILNSSDVQIPVKILEVFGDKLIIDMNHPLAGIELNFEITLIQISR